jgi:erythromycin esterase
MMIRAILRVLVILLLITATARAQSVFDALKDQLVPIDSNQQDGYTMNMDLFSKAISGNQILALGEATHGTKNFVDFRLAIIKKLVGEHGYRAIVTESDFSSTLAMNDYIVYGKGNVQKCLQDMGYWMWNNPDFLETITWLKDYNATRDINSRVHIYGCDMTVPMIIGVLLGGKQVLKKPLSPESVAGMKVLSAWHTKSLAKDEEIALKHLAEEVKVELAAHPDTSTFRNSLNTILQVIAFRMAGQGKVSSAIRDKFMLENMNWILKREHGGKLIFMAHNLHIARKPMIGGWENVGTLLGKTFGAKYYALGLSFYKGEFRAQDRNSGKSAVFQVAQTSKNALEYTFNETGVPNFYLDFASVKGKAALVDLLFEKRSLRSIGAIFSSAKKDEAATSIDAVAAEVFDGLVFFSNTHAIAPSFGWKK